jgi:hypothetical protein
MEKIIKKEFQYFTSQLSGNPTYSGVIEKLDYYGKLGWELIQVLYNWDASTGIYFFKREKEGD